MLKKIEKSVNFGKRKVVEASQPDLMISFKFHQDAVTFYFHLSVFSQRKLKFGQGESGKSQGISD